MNGLKNNFRKIISIFANQFKIRCSKNRNVSKYFYTFFVFLVPLFNIEFLKNSTIINNIQELSGNIKI